MPKDMEGFEDPQTLIEYRGIRGGEKGDKAPVKTPPRVRMPIKNAGSKKFDIDMKVMLAAARRLSVKRPDDNWARDVHAIPVLLFSDKAVGNDGVVFLERALYTGRGRWCASQAEQEKARQLVDIGAYAKNKTIKNLPKPKEVDCTSDCPMWGTPEKPTDCKWRSIVTVQLVDSPVFPDPTRCRTRSKYSIRAMLTSLNYISQVTGGVLQGIPLWLTQSKIDVKDAKGERRRIPVWHFSFHGTLQQLREFAAQELASRKMLSDAHDGKVIEVKGRKFVDADLGGGDEIDLDAGFEDNSTDDEEIEGDDDAEPSDESIEMQSKIALLYKKLNYTPARRKAVESKHEGDLQGILAELRDQAPAGFDPAAGEPGEEEEEENESQSTSSDDDDNDLTDDLFD